MTKMYAPILYLKQEIFDEKNVYKGEKLYTTKKIFGCNKCDNLVSLDFITRVRNNLTDNIIGTYEE